MPALLFGSISTLVDTSELQRDAFNQAFAEHGLEWNWSQEEYRSLLGDNGGAARIEAYARTRGEDVDASAVHATKSQIFRDNLAASPVAPRPGVREAIQGARGAGLKVAVVTTTSAENVSAVLGALGPEVGPKDFDLVLSASDVQPGKPDPAVYERALADLGESAGTAVAVEDNPGGLDAAAAAGIPCLAFPNQNTAALDFDGATATVDRIDLDQVQGLLAA